MLLFFIASIIQRNKFVKASTTPPIRKSPDIKPGEKRGQGKSQPKEFITRKLGSLPQGVMRKINEALKGALGLEESAQSIT